MTPAIGPKKDPIVSIIESAPDWLKIGSHKPPNIKPIVTISSPELDLSKP